MNPPLMYNTVLCRYAEIALKKANRSHFERILVKNIRSVLSEIKNLSIERVRGRITIRKSDNALFSEAEVTILRKGLSRVFGLSSFSMGLRVDASLVALEDAIMPMLPLLLARFGARPVRYRMRARRSEKDFPMRSREIEIHFADRLLTEYPDDLTLNLGDDADLTIWVEVRRDWAFVCFEQVPGLNGLPVGSSSDALVLLSGGIDSPVAAYLMMGRGCRQDFLTFHSFPYTTDELIDKVCGLANVLNRYQSHGRLFACNLAEAQKMIRDSCSERFRTVLYRRLMFRVAAVLALDTGAKALVTGESLGQVASQTMANLGVINRATDMLILRPLLAMDKLQVTAAARTLGTLTLSNIQCADSCTVFMPQHPTTNAKLHLIEREEARLGTERLLAIAIKGLTLINLETGECTEFVCRTMSR